MTAVRERLRALSIELPTLGPPRYAYEATSHWGGLLYVSGQISRSASGEVLRGRLGEDATVGDGVVAARAAALNLLARVEEAIGLDRARVLKLNAWAASAPSFVDQPTVIDGASQLLIDVLGDHGRHARTALPTQVLPQGALVELDATIAIRG
ncbi:MULTISPECIES: RidA family protein [Streptomyces]|uniref:RidA family protein n=1 Tax=Streptomyces TaxID=1883 RepID=UPI0004C95386|nr:MULTISPECIES: RidA family protein [Streptomyces]MDX2917012.1 RidA family protein [Streptomyces sp. NE06-03C]MDX3607784.1 RidA family protein [Streptomyces sp. FL06-04B]MDX3736381.1 RidA family protein [Streptomyces sp. ID01-15D]